MGKIFIIIGKSATGKDTIYKRLLEMENLDLKTAVMYTTRPIRNAEVNGVEYYFVNEEKLRELEKENKVIEHRAYDTVHGVWHYFTVNDGQIDLEKASYLMLGTLESYIQIKDYYGRDYVEAIYLEVEDGIRLTRALEREKKQVSPKYAEMCRRFLADDRDFSEEKLEEQGITKKFMNIDSTICLQEIADSIKNFTIIS